MELTARDSTNKTVAIIIVLLSFFVLLSLTSNILLVFQNKYLSSHRETVVTPMAYNAPFVISEANSSASHMQMMALSFIALRLNVSPETVDAQHQFLLGYVKSSVQPDFRIILAQEAQRIKNNVVSSAFYQTQLQIFPDQNRIDIRGVLKTWIGNADPQVDIKQYSLQLSYTNGVTSIEKFVEIVDEEK